MRALIACFVLVFAAFASAQDSFDKHGKTDADILKMGAEKWSDFYTSKEGTSTASMTAAAVVYGEVAKSRNDGLLQHMSNSKRRTLFLRLRKSLNDYSTATVDVAYCESGGGTMYNTMWAAVSGVVEDLLYSLISGTGPKGKAMVVSKVQKQISVLQKQIEATHKDEKNNEFFKYDDAKKALAALRKSFASITALAKGMNRADSDRILGFCLDQAKNADFDSPK